MHSQLHLVLEYFKGVANAVKTIFVGAKTVVHKNIVCYTRYKAFRHSNFGTNKNSFGIIISLYVI